MKRDWVLSYCDSAKRPTSRSSSSNGAESESRTGRLLNDRTYDRFPMIALAAIPDRKTRGEIARMLALRFSAILK